jgi:hypothetical protein
LKRKFGTKKYNFGPSEVRAPAEQLTVDHYFAYFGPSGVRALPLADCTNEGGHYFRYFWSERRCADGV